MTWTASRPCHEPARRRQKTGLHPGENACSAAYVNNGGRICSADVNVDTGYAAVRPAIWVSGL